MANYTIITDTGEKIEDFGTLEKCLSSVRQMKYSEYPINIKTVIFDSYEI